MTDEEKGDAIRVALADYLSRIKALRAEFKKTVQAILERKRQEKIADIKEQITSNHD